MATAPGVCALGWVKCRKLNCTAGYTLYNYVCDKKKQKCLNIGQPIYRSISNTVAPLSLYITLIEDGCTEDDKSREGSFCQRPCYS